MPKYDLILFDLDGTLTDPASGLVKSFSYALSRMGVDCRDRESLKRFIGIIFMSITRCTAGVIT